FAPTPPALAHVSDWLMCQDLELPEERGSQHRERPLHDDSNCPDVRIRRVPSRRPTRRSPAEAGLLEVAEATQVPKAASAALPRGLPPNPSPTRCR
ncbi:MAG: hypothetical protein AAGF12_14560, partial [Myxococcota bacterium]